MTKINCEIDNGIAVIKMDDGKANAMDNVFFGEFGEALDRVETDNAKVLIFAGRPGFFSGGLDLKLLTTLQPKDLPKFAETLALAMLRVFSLKKGCVSQGKKKLKVCSKMNCLEPIVNSSGGVKLREMVRSQML